MHSQAQREPGERTRRAAVIRELDRHGQALGGTAGRRVGPRVPRRRAGRRARRGIRCCPHHDATRPGRGLGVEFRPPGCGFEGPGEEARGDQHGMAPRARVDRRRPPRARRGHGPRGRAPRSSWRLRAGAGSRTRAGEERGDGEQAAAHAARPRLGDSAGPNSVRDAWKKLAGPFVRWRKRTAISRCARDRRARRRRAPGRRSTACSPPSPPLSWTRTSTPSPSGSTSGRSVSMCGASEVGAPAPCSAGRAPGPPAASGSSTRAAASRPRPSPV